MKIPYIRFKISIMKIVYFILVVFNCYSIFGQQQNKYDLELNEFEKENAELISQYEKENF